MFCSIYFLTHQNFKLLTFRFVTAAIGSFMADSASCFASKILEILIELVFSLQSYFSQGPAPLFLSLAQKCLPRLSSPPPRQMVLERSLVCTEGTQNI